MKELLEKPENFPTFVTVHIRTYKLERRSEYGINGIKGKRF